METVKKKLQEVRQGRKKTIDKNASTYLGNRIHGRKCQQQDKRQDRKRDYSSERIYDMFPGEEKGLESGREEEIQGIRQDRN